MLYTTIAFFVLTTLFVVLQVRKKSAEAPIRSVACPRCSATLLQGTEICTECGAPLQAFEIVAAKIVEDTPDAGEKLHAIVRADMCVGCGTCVDACPHPGAIQMVHKLAVVNTERCEGAGSCVAACPVGGIALTSGASVQRVEVPHVNVNFESNVPGLYVVGELGGRGLIKNAVNEGRLAIEHVAKELPPHQPRSDGRLDVFDVLIVGSGPAGISAGLEAHQCGLSYMVVEQGSLSDTIRKYPRKKLLFAEPIRVPMYGDLWIADGTKEELLAVWTKVIQETGLHVRTGERVVKIERPGDVFELTCDTGHSWHGRRVVLAMGRRGTPRKLGVPGEHLDKVLYDIVEMEAFEGQRVVVVGGGDSAIESALGLANQEGTHVVLSYRGTDFSRAKERNRKKLDEAVQNKTVHLLLESQVKEIREDVVVLEYQGALHVLQNDAVIVRIGGEAPTPFLQRLGIRIVRKEIAIATESRAAAGAET